MGVSPQFRADSARSGWELGEISTETEGSENEIDSDQIMMTIVQRTREHGHQAFYAIEDSGGAIIDVHQRRHRFMGSDVIDRRKHWIDFNTMDASNYDLYERDEHTSFYETRKHTP
jgi:hypothetical protein